jgi:hypothetical protein
LQPLDYTQLKQLHNDCI